MKYVNLVKAVHIESVRRAISFWAILHRSSSRKILSNLRVQNVTEQQEMEVSKTFTITALLKHANLFEGSVTAFKFHELNHW